jgi:hypothetical protein
MYNLQSPQLATLQSQVLISLGTSERIESQKINSCHYHGRCKSVFCPQCLRSAGYARKDRLFTAINRETARKWKLVTMKAANIWPEAVREAAQAMPRAVRAAFKKLKIADYAQSYETSFTNWTEDAHPHVHIVTELPKGGRRHVSPAALEDAWLSELPAWLHTSEPVHLDATRSTEATSFYVYKSPFWQEPGTPGHSQNMVHKIVAGITSTKGLQRFSLRGSLAA